MKEIKLNHGLVALVDDEDYELISQYKWQVLKSKKINYANRGCRINGKRASMIMHRFIMSAPKGMQVDHINHNGLDNRKCNLRLCTRSENGMNQLPKFLSSKFKGVHWNKSKRKWVSQIHLNSKREYIGYFALETDAALAYNAWATELFGEFAYLNDVNTDMTFTPKELLATSPQVSESSPSKPQVPQQASCSDLSIAQ